MELSVVIPTLDGRDHLGDALDATGRVAPEAEVVVVNGPSTDGTGGLVRDHDVPDCLLEVPERNLNVARNAGIAATTGDVVAFLGQGSGPEAGWVDTVRDAVAAGADAVTGPVHRTIGGGVTTETAERSAVVGREVTFFDGGNVAFTRAALDALDGFDEYLALGGARDLAHRLAGAGRRVSWHTDFAVLRTDDADPVTRVADEHDGAWGLRYRCRAYTLAKNYGVRPSVLAETTSRAGSDALTALRGVLSGEGRLSRWLGNGRDVVGNSVRGTAAGLRARATDRTPRRNPHGVSSRDDRAVVSRPC
jgi:glycosyltransferase involved in cell wall biosynthesis